MHTISAGQIRAARVFLNWTREDLAAAANLSASTIRNLEKGQRSFRSTETIRQTLELRGIEFTENEGICRRSDEVRIIRGLDSCEILLDDIIRTTQTKDAPICAIMKSQNILLESLAVPENGNLSNLERLTQKTKMKCLLADTQTLPCTMRQISFKTVSKHAAGPVSHYIYGDKCALVLPESNATFKFVIFHAADVARSYLDYFDTLWNIATPFVMVKELAD